MYPVYQTNKPRARNRTSREDHQRVSLTCDFTLIPEGTGAQYRNHEISKNKYEKNNNPEPCVFAHFVSFAFKIPLSCSRKQPLIWTLPIYEIATGNAREKFVGMLGHQHLGSASSHLSVALVIAHS